MSEGYGDNNLRYLISTLRWVGFYTGTSERKYHGVTPVPRPVRRKLREKNTETAHNSAKQETGRLSWCLVSTKYNPRGKYQILSKFLGEQPGGSDWRPGCKG
jgi:hypothetical protein